MIASFLQNLHFAFDIAAFDPAARRMKAFLAYEFRRVFHSGHSMYASSNGGELTARNEKKLGHKV